MKEIEYKYLVNHDLWTELEKPEPKEIIQGYLAKNETSTVRIRLKDAKAYLTIKGITIGVSRSEFEYEIPVEEAKIMLEEMTNNFISKKRYEITYQGFVWEVDVFGGKLAGLILAEIEVPSEDTQFEKPEWVTKDVSTDKEYYNAVLIDKC